MLKSNPNSKARILAVSTIFVVAAAASAQSTDAFQGIYVGNDGAFTELDGNGGNTTASNAWGGTYQFTGDDRSGVQQTMTVNATAYSSSSYGQLHAYGAGTVINSYYNANNAPIFDGSSFNASGSPDLIGIHGNAGWSDTFTYTGFQGTGYKVDYIFALDGNVSGDVEAGLNFSTSDPNGQSYNPRTNVGGTTDWVTPDYQVTWGSAFTVNVDFYAGMTTYLSQHPDGQTYSAYADFSDTLSLVGMVIKDSNGNVVNGWNYTSGSGTIYAVPEPSGFAILGLGLAGLVLVRRARS